MGWRRFGMWCLLVLSQGSQVCEGVPMLDGAGRGASGVVDSLVGLDVGRVVVLMGAGGGAS